MNPIRPLARLFQRRRRGARTRIGHSFASFARAVRARYCRSPALLGGGDRVFLRYPGTAATSVYHHRWFLSRRAPSFLMRFGVRVAPAITIAAAPRRENATVLPGQLVRRAGARVALPSPARSFLPISARPRPRRADPASPVSGVRAARARDLVTIRGTAPRQVPLLPLAHPELARGEPTEIRGARSLGPSEQLRRVEDPSLATVRAAMRRIPSPTDAPASRRRQDDWPPAPPPAWARSAVAAQPGMPPPQIDLQAVTSQVMRQIDRRLIAWRERTGRA